MRRSTAYFAGNAVRMVIAVVPDAVAVGAVGLIAYGAWEIYQPAGFIVAGVLVLAGVLLQARGAV